MDERARRYRFSTGSQLLGKTVGAGNSTSGLVIYPRCPDCDIWGRPAVS